MGDLRERILEKNALDQMDKNATIEDVKCSLQYNYSFQARLITGASTGGTYNRKNFEWITDYDNINHILNNGDIDSYINDNYRPNNKSILSHYKDVSGTVYLCPTIKFKIKYFNNETFYASKQIKINRNNYYFPLINYLDSEICVCEETDDELVLLCEGEKIKLDKISKTDFSNKDDDSILNPSFVLEYLKNNNKWVNSTISNVEENTDFVSIRVRLADTSISINYSTPFNDNNRIWDLLDYFEESDPWCLENRSISVTLRQVVNYGYNEDLIYITRTNDKMSIFDKIKHRIKTLTNK